MAANEEDKIERMNRIMKKHVADLDSPYATYPMANDRWADPKETTPKGEPCFIKAEKGQTTAKAPRKPNYAFGPGKFGFGYYHLTTKQAYVILYARMANNGASGCGCSKGERQEMDDFDDVRRIVYARSVADKPNDGHAIKDAVESNKAFASSEIYYNDGMDVVQLIRDIRGSKKKT